MSCLYQGTEVEIKPSIFLSRDKRDSYNVHYYFLVLPENWEMQFKSNQGRGFHPQWPTSLMY